MSLVLTLFVESYMNGELLDFALKIIRHRDSFSVLDSNSELHFIAQRFQSVLNRQEEYEIFSIMKRFNKFDSSDESFSEMFVKLYYHSSFEKAFSNLNLNSLN